MAQLMSGCTPAGVTKRGIAKKERTSGSRVAKLEVQGEMLHGLAISHTRQWNNIA